MKSFWIVALGGTFGTLSRYGIAEAVHPDTLFPLATFLVNITGSFLLGAVLAALIVRGDDIGHRRTLRLLLGTGFLGGYTTYSTLSVETDTLLRTDHVALGLAYAIATVIGGLLAAFAGIVAARAVGPMIPLWMALAGGIGAGTRYWVDAFVRPRVSATLPWSTHLINITGSLLLGLIVGLDAGNTWHTVAGTGFLGGFTTFSTASVETARLAIDGRYRAAFVNASGMIVLSVAAGALGYALGHGF